MHRTTHPFWLNALRELRQPLVALASLLVIVNLATATASAHQGTPWAQLCIGSTTATPDGETAPATMCSHCCFAVQAQLVDAGPVELTLTTRGAARVHIPASFALTPRHDTRLFGPRGPPELA